MKKTDKFEELIDAIDLASVIAAEILGEYNLDEDSLKELDNIYKTLFVFSAKLNILKKHD